MKLSGAWAPSIFLLCYTKATGLTHLVQMPHTCLHFNTEKRGKEKNRVHTPFMGTGWQGYPSPVFMFHWHSFSCSVMSHSLQPHGLQCVRLRCPPLSPRACSNSCPLSQWCHPTISSSVNPFSSYLQSFSASDSFPISWLFALRWQKYWSFSISINEYSES